MALLNFNKKFADNVETGLKTQTIRAFRKYPIEGGDTLYLYTGLRSKYSKKLRQVRCKIVFDIEITKNSILIEPGWKTMSGLDCQSRLTATHHLDQFAKLDGFSSWREMKEWWLRDHGLPFRGMLIMW